MTKQEVFGSRVGMMFAMLGMAVGTGNIWRFPRIAAKNGGGEFLIAWVVFLFLWSIPLILIEFGMAHKTRRGPFASFIEFMGPKWAWMGAFCVLVTAAIAFYYSVVAGWTLRYVVASFTGEIPTTEPGLFWDKFTNSYEPIFSYVAILGAALFVVIRGVRAIERIGLIVMPCLILLVIVLAIRAITLPGALEGISYLFAIEWSNLAEPRIWVDALAQNAWDTGAGWGLVLCYAVYLREREDTTLNACILPVANNVISLLAAVIIFSTVFSIVPQLIEKSASNPDVLIGLGALGESVSSGRNFSPELLQETIFSESNTGLTFIWIPQLFNTLPFGQVLMACFFSALCFAAFTSLISLIEASTRSLVDAGITRRKALRIVGFAVFMLGLPSALSLTFLERQDWVWGVALLLTGGFFSVAVVTYGVKQFRARHLNHIYSDIRIGRWWDFVITYLIPIQAVSLLFWFLYKSWLDNSTEWLHPFSSTNIFNVGTVILHIGIALILLISLNLWITQKGLAHKLKTQNSK